MNDHNPKTQQNETKIAPWLSVGNIEKAMDFYQAAFGVSELYRLYGDDGKPIIIQFSFGGADFWLQEYPDNSPDSAEHGSVRMIVTVKDPDSTFERALAAGAIEVTPVSEGFGWRVGRLKDPLGYHWEISKPLKRPLNLLIFRHLHN